jgi:hypothetical protein
VKGARSDFDVRMFCLPYATSTSVTDEAIAAAAAR